MQFMAALDTNESTPAAVYVAAHDAKAESKTFTTALSADSKSLSFQIGATPPNAGVASVDSYTVAYPVVVTAVQGTWWDAAQVYRNWVLEHATWVQAGPMSQRSELAPWMFNLTTWVNSHWQGLDIFNRTGGDPTVVKNRVSNIVNRFGLRKDALALHWFDHFACLYSSCVPAFPRNEL